MKIIWSERIDEILKIGISLEKVGVKNWALTKCQALTVLDFFEIHNIPVIGGDVYVLKNNIIQSNYDNWSYDDLTDNEFQKKSVEKARNYIEKYKINTKEKLYFALVPGSYNDRIN